MATSNMLVFIVMDNTRISTARIQSLVVFLQNYILTTLCVRYMWNLGARSLPLHRDSPFSRYVIVYVSL
jgi:hypothetical protein